MLLAVVIALIVGGTIGVAGGVAIARRRDDRASAPPTSGAVASAQPVVPPASVDNDDDVGVTLRAAVDQLSLGVVVGDASGRVVYLNQSAAAMRGTHVGLIIDEHVERALATARNGERLDDSVVLHGPPRLTLQLVAEPMPSGFSIATIEDITEQSRIDAMRTDFVANISHELKTPVGAIAVLAEALFGETERDVVDRIAGRMVDEAHRVVAAIDDLLELSRIESGPRVDEVTDLVQIVQTAIARGRVYDEAKGVTVSAFDVGAPVMLRGDSRQLVSAIGNLVENAVKYSEERGVVQVRTRRDEHAIEVMVADNGDGIPERDLDRIFERFYRVDRARSRQTGGTGLGLSIVRHVATNHGGDVLVSSSEGEGSTFVFRLPARLLVEPDPTPSGTVDSAVDDSLSETNIEEQRS